MSPLLRPTVKKDGQVAKDEPNIPAAHGLDQDAFSSSRNERNVYNSTFIFHAVEHTISQARDTWTLIFPFPIQTYSWCTASKTKAQQIDVICLMFYQILWPSWDGNQRSVSLCSPLTLTAISPLNSLK